MFILCHFRPSVVLTLANVHEFVLKDCHHIPWAGGMATSSELQPETKDLKRVEPGMDDGYARNLLMERIALANRCVDVAMPTEVFVGPTTYDRFLHCFMSLLKKKESEIKNLLNDSRYSMLINDSQLNLYMKRRFLSISDTFKINGECFCKNSLKKIFDMVFCTCKIN